MYTVGALAKRCGLSRSTLLYYDSLGLLAPSCRTAANYRVYTEQDAERLDQICTYRRAGIPLKEIARILESPESSLARILEERLDELNCDIERLREQQRLIIGLLRNEEALGRIGVMNRETWVALLSASGFSNDDMIRWHVEFERLYPAKHRAFLEFLCIPDDEIEMIRSWASAAGNEAPARTDDPVEDAPES